MSADLSSSPPPPRSVAEQAATGFRWLTIMRLAGQALQWGVTLIVIRLLQPSDYGLMAMATVFISALGLFSEIGMEAALIQKPEVPLRTLRQTFGLLLLINLGFSGVVFACAPFVAAFYTEPNLAPIVKVLAAQFVVGACAVLPRTLLMRRLAFRPIAIVRFCVSVLTALVALVLAWLGYGVWALVISQLMSEVAATILFNIAEPFFHRPIFRFDGLREVASFGGIVLAERVAWYAYSSLDLMLVGKLLGSTAVGSYSVGKELASMPVTKGTPILSQVAYPALSRLQDDPETLNRQFLQLVRVVALAAFPVAFGVCAVAPELVATVLGEKWTDAVIPLMCISLVGPLRVVNSLISNLLRSAGKPSVSLGNTVVAAVVVTCAWGVGCAWGVAGVSIAWLLSYPPYFLFAAYRTSLHSDLHMIELLRAIARPALLSFVMLAALTGLRPFLAASFTTATVLAVLVFLGAALYGALVFAFDRGTLTRFKQLALG